MTVQVNSSDRPGLADLVTETAPVILLYTALVLPNQQPQLEEIPSGSGGHARTVTVNTSSLCTACALAVDERTKDTFKFHCLADQWKTERKPHSTVAAMAALPSYQKIIGMGKDVLPFILAELKSEGSTPDHWFWALAAISDANPVPPESRGKISEMAEAWLTWGRAEGYVD
jgi:hypothetical protein